MKRFRSLWCFSYDVPFMAPSSERWIPWIMGLMIFLATLCAMIFMESWGVSRGWQQDLKGRWTIEVTPRSKRPDTVNTADQNRSEDDPKNFERFKKDVLKIILSDPSVTQAHPLERQHLLKTLKPWLGEGNLLDDLPLPLFIDVSCNPHVPLNVQHLKQELQTLAESVTIQDHEAWYTPLMQLMRFIQGLSVGLSAVIFGAAAAMMMIMVSMNLSIHRDVVHTLQLIGASDAYIVKQYQKNMYGVAFKAWCIGFLPSLFSLIFFQWLSATIQIDVGLQAPSMMFLWGLAFIIPTCFCLFLLLTTRITVLRELRRDFI